MERQPQDLTGMPAGLISDYFTNQTRAVWPLKNGGCQRDGKYSWNWRVEGMHLDQDKIDRIVFAPIKGDGGYMVSIPGQLQTIIYPRGMQANTARVIAGIREYLGQDVVLSYRGNDGHMARFGTAELQVISIGQRQILSIAA